MVDLPVQLVVLSIPSLVYATVHRWRGENWNEAFRRIGWQGSRLVHFLWSLGVMVVAGGLGWLALRTVPSEALQGPNVNISAYAGWKLNITTFLLVWLREAIYVALGEEVFFRGLLGGWLVRRLGFAIGNTTQALIFLLPHLLLLLVSLNFWPVIVVQMVAGWLLGWLRYRSDSILPGWLAHSLINASGALAAMN